MNSRIHLRPRSRPEDRVWTVGEAPAVPGAGLALAVEPGCHDGFSSLLLALSDLETRGIVRRAEADAVREDVRAARGELADGTTRADAVVMAVMRRISRESVYTARAVDRAAKLLNAGFARAGIEEVALRDVERLDRPSLKVFARAVLVQPAALRFGWRWFSRRDPLAAPESGDIAARSRARLLAQIAVLCEFDIRGTGTARVAESAVEIRPVRDVARELVIQNYDACFRWTPDSLAADPHGGESIRLRAIAAINVGEHALAEGLLRDAEEGATDPARAAHLAYLRGLLAAKRDRRLERSDEHHVRGLRYLGDGTDAEAQFERAWLFNGLALNEMIRWRQTRADRGPFDRAWQFEQDAFEIARLGGDARHVYLRHNLLANTAFMLEIAGRPDLALSMFRQVFAEQLDVDERQQARWRATLGYRIGVLQLRCGDAAGARGRLSEAAAAEPDDLAWPTRERILGALGSAAAADGDGAAAVAAHEEGLRLASDHRAYESARDHLTGLACALRDLGSGDEARRRIAEVNEAEDLVLADPNDLDGLNSRPVPSKLPAYVAVVDLEGLPDVDLNRYLVADPSAAAAWRA